jgi:hypothetical protein
MSKKHRFEKNLKKEILEKKEEITENTQVEDSDKKEYLMDVNTPNAADQYEEPSEDEVPAFYEEEDDDYSIEDVEPLTTENINYLKSIYPNLKLTMMVNQPIVWKTIPRNEYRLAYDLTEEEREHISSLDPANQIAELMEIRNQKIVTYFVLFPSRPRLLYLLDRYSGMIPTLAEEILKGSGYSLQQPSIDL